MMILKDKKYDENFKSIYHESKGKLKEGKKQRFIYSPLNQRRRKRKKKRKIQINKETERIVFLFFLNFVVNQTEKCHVK